MRKSKLRRRVPAKPADIELMMEKAIEPGATLEIAKSLTWLRLPLPFVLNHVNLLAARGQ